MNFKIPKEIKVDFSRLPNEVFFNIFLHLEPRELNAMVATCKRFHDIILESRDLNKNFELVFQESRWSKSPRLELLKKMDAEGPRKFKQLKIISVNAAYCSVTMGFRNIFNNLLGLKVCLTVESLIIRRCGYMEFPVLSEFLKMFPNLKSIEYRENKSLYSDGYQLSDIKQNKVSRDSTVDAVPLEPKDTPVFEHLTTLKYYSKDKFQCTNVFQNASRLKRLETNCPNFTTFSAFDNLEHLKIYFVYSLSYSSPTSNFFEDKIQNRIKFKLRSFSLGQQKVNNVFKFKITKFLETHSKTLEELTLKASNLPERAVQQILIMPNLRKLQLLMLYNEDNPNLDGCPPGESIESPGKTFEEVFIEKNLSVTYLALDWTDDDTSIKFINLFPNCQSLYLHLWAKSDRQKKSQYVIEFPLLKNLFETSLCCNVSDDELDYIRVGNSLKACDFTWIKNKEACAIAWTKFIKRNINIRKLSLTNEIDHHSLLVITSKMRQLKHLDIKSLSFQSENFIDQPMVDIICDYAPIQDIEMKQVKETFGNQIVDKYYVNKERCPSDVFINLNTESKMMDIKIFHNAKYSVYAYDYAKYRHSDCKKLTLL